jgi:tRNA (guanine-N1)-methyltransferase
VKIDILTLFPEMFAPLDCSIIKRAKDNGIVDIGIHNIRDFTEDKHKKVDDYPYGGGWGMVMMAQPVYDAVDYVAGDSGVKPRILLMSPGGKVFNQDMAVQLSHEKHLLFICGHYEGIDERVKNIVDDEVSIGDYVLTGGELPSMVIIDSLCRMLPGVLSSDSSYEDESFYSGFLEYPQYTRPEVFRGMEVPEVLLSGHHENIRKWRRFESIKKTLKARPDIVDYEKLSKEDKKIVQEIQAEGLDI